MKEQPKTENISEKKELFDLIKRSMILTAALWVFFNFIIGIEVMPGIDMEPGIMPGDILIYYRPDRKAAIRDVIVLRKDDDIYVGRVVACGGDKVEITEGSSLMVNDNTVTEENIFFRTSVYEKITEYPVILSSDECFVLSDMREGGRDSRYYGPVNKDEIMGTVIGLYRRRGI